MFIMLMNKILFNRIREGGITMCGDCGFYECPGACPGADAPRVVYKCAECGENITLDDGVCYECNGRVYHDYCVDGISRQRLLYEFEIGRDELLEAAGFREMTPEVF
jgi:hypothetical protein